MLFKLIGFLNTIIYKLKYGKDVCLEGIPTFVSRPQIYVKSGKVNIGKNFSIKQGGYIAAVDGGRITIGKNVSFNRNCILVSHDSITIGNNVAIGPNVVFYDHDHNYDKTGIMDGYSTEPIVIENDCWIGAGVILLKGTIVGKCSVIGAGCVVQGSIPPHSLVTSNRDLNILSIKDKKIL